MTPGLMPGSMQQASWQAIKKKPLRRNISGEAFWRFIPLPAGNRKPLTAGRGHEDYRCHARIGKMEHGFDLCIAGHGGRVLIGGSVNGHNAPHAVKGFASYRAISLKK